MGSGYCRYYDCYCHRCDKCFEQGIEKETASRFLVKLVVLLLFGGKKNETEGNKTQDGIEL